MIERSAGGFVLNAVAAKRGSWHHTNMKLSLATMAFALAASIACSATRSASSPAENATANQPGQSSATQASPTSPEKQPCTLNLTQAPEIKSLKLGMTTDEVLAVFPGSKDDPEMRTQLSRPPTQFGATELAIRPHVLATQPDFSGLSRITFSLLDGRVSSLSVHYNGPQWPHVDKFVEKLVGEMNLPPSEQWEAYAGQDTQLKTLTCADFSIRVNAAGEGGNLNYVSMTDLEAEKKLRERRRKAREQASPTPGN